MMSNLRAFLHTTGLFLRVIPYVLIAWPISTYSQQTTPPLTIDQLRRRATAPETINMPEKFINEYVKDYKIGFLPTKEVRLSLRQAKVPEPVINVLAEFTALYLRVCEFECRNCNAENGKVLAKQIRDSIAASRKSNNAFIPFFEGGIDPQICPVDVPNKNDTNHVLVLVAGNIVRNKQKYKIEVNLSYLNYAEIGGKLINRRSFEVRVSDSTQEVNKQIAEWVIDSLKASM